MNLGEYIPLYNDFDIANELDNDYKVSDADIARLSQGDGFPMTEFQTKHFVVGDGLTPYRMRRQALVEIDTRRSSLHSMIKNMNKAKAELALIYRDLDNQADILKRNLIQCEYDDKLYDITVWNHKIPQARRELKEMIDHLRSLFDSEPTTEDIKNISKEDPAQEKLYWQVRMAKQTAVDMIAHGRVGAGQMSSIMMMEPEDQRIVLSKAIEYSAQMDNTIGALEHESRKKILGVSRNTVPELNAAAIVGTVKELTSSTSIDE